MERYDVAIIGGGPAGTSAGRNAAKYGLKAVIFEKAKYPRDKPCGGALSSRTDDLLGDVALSHMNCKVTRLDIYSPSLKKISIPNKCGHFVIRSEFDAAMAKDARKSDAEVFDECPVSKINRLESGEYEVVSGKKVVTARYIVMATGVQNNKLIKDLGIRTKWPEGHLARCAESETAVENEILDRINDNDKTLSVFFGVVPSGYGWYFVKDGYLNVGIGSFWHDIKEQGPNQIYEDFVNLLKKEGLVPEGLVLNRPRHHILAFKKPAEKTVFDRVVLVGDAAGFVSPVTGEGLYYSILSGKLAAKAIRDDSEGEVPLESYEESWKRAFGRDLAGPGLFLQKVAYKSRGWMELIVTLGRHDEKMADIFRQVVFGEDEYKNIIKKMVLRFPVALIKAIF